jgi:sugar O-acyltransferase (sialic acid O-acetyltransferase NeuD family)
VIDVLIYGAGGFAREVQQLAADLRLDGAPLQVIGFLSDDLATHGTSIAGCPVLGGMSYLAMHSGRFDVVIGIGAPAVKRRLVAAIGTHARAFPSLVHPTVVRSTRVEVGRGAILCAASVLTVDIRLGEFVTINLACTVGHDVTVADYATIAPGTNISGSVSIQEGCDIGTGASVIQGISIGEWTVVGAGAVVTSDLPANCTAVGVPARPIKRRPRG